MKLRNLIIGILCILILALAGYAYWYFMMGPVQIPVSNQPTTTNPGFHPLNPGGQATSTGTSGTVLTPGGTKIPTTPAGKPPILRLLSNMPVGGYSASTTASSTNIVWVDRGRGNVYQASDLNLDVATVSNTVVPKVFNALWNKNLTAFVGSLYEDGNLTPTNIYAELQKQRGAGASSTASVTPYELQGKNIPGDIIGYAVSPDKSRLFIMFNENGSGVGYISAFNGTGMTRLFSTPLTQVSVDWPSDNIISIVTKGSALYNGFLYFVSPKTGVWTRVLGPIAGLSATVSHDGKNVLYSATTQNKTVRTAIYSIGAATSTDAIVRTIADKCAWGRQYTTLVYCGVPSDLASATYPDDWYFGSLTTNDKIWQLNAVTGEVRQIATLVDQADRTIDAYRLGTDPRDKYLFFMNKNDLSLWSLDLTRSISGR
jgi:hypothetical protein